MATSIETLTAQLMLTQAFLARIIVTHPEPRVLVGELEEAIKAGLIVAAVATSGANEMVESIQCEARHWHRILEEQIARTTGQHKL